jgi:hypothetical protein
MTELQFYKFIQENELELDWRGNELIIWIPFDYIQEFTKLIGYNSLCEGGLDVNLQYDKIVFDLVIVCDWFNIDPENIESR